MIGQHFTSPTMDFRLDRMSGFETTSGSQDLTTFPGSATPCGLHIFPVELLVKVMTHLPDTASLSRLFTAYPKTLDAFKEFGHQIFISIVTNMYPELRNASLNALVARSRPPKITDFIEDELKAKDSCVQFRLRDFSLSALLDLIKVSGSIESLTDSFAREHILAPRDQLNMPLSTTELHRIRRSFWRFQFQYDMCHPEELKSSRKSDDTKSRSSRRYVYYQTLQPFSKSVPNWLQCRNEKHRPKALSCFLSTLSRWEHDELEAIRFHLAHKVNRLQYLRSCGSEDDLTQQPVLLQRLIRDIDSWDPKSPKDHVLVAAFRQTQYAKDRLIDCCGVCDAGSRNTTHGSLIDMDHKGHPQWGWCMWDEQRLVKRGMIDFKLDGWLDNWKWDDKRAAKISDRRAALKRLHGECVDSQYTILDRRIEAQFGIDARLHKDRIKWDTIWHLGPEERKWMPTELDCIYKPSSHLSMRQAFISWLRRVPH